MTKKNALLLLVAIICLGLGLGWGLRQRAAPVSSAPAATPAAAASATASVRALFAQTLPDAKGQAQALEQWRGKAIVVNFWATWCPPCIQEMPELNLLQAELGPKGMQILGIGIDSPSNIAEFSTKYKIAYPLYVAGMGGTALAQDFGNQTGGLPYTVLIGADGHVKKTYLGRLDFNKLRADLASL
jgi:thiol-disulfide isomerase/thioredoxin